MHYEVLMTDDAEHDVEAICEYIAEFDSPANAEHVWRQLQIQIDSLTTLPERGTYPKELQALGMRTYRQSFFKPYRIIYRVLGKQVLIFMIVDGRRDIKSLLTYRLLGA